MTCSPHRYEEFLSLSCNMWYPCVRVDKRKQFLASRKWWWGEFSHGHLVLLHSGFTHVSNCACGADSRLAVAPHSPTAFFRLSCHGVEFLPQTHGCCLRLCFCALQYLVQQGGHKPPPSLPPSHSPSLSQSYQPSVSVCKTLYMQCSLPLLWHAANWP